MFTPHTEIETQEMLKTIGVKRLEDLFTDVPSSYRFPKLNLPEGLTEIEAMDELQEYARAKAIFQTSDALLKRLNQYSLLHI